MGVNPAPIKERRDAGLHFCVNPDESVQKLGRLTTGAACVSLEVG